MKTSKKPVKSFRNTYCDYEEVVLVFRHSPAELTYMQFREKISTQKKEFMGMKTVEVDPSLSNKDI